MTAIAVEPPTVIGYFEPGSPEWHAARLRGIGGSEIAAVMGLSPYESRFSLWHRKQGMTGDVEENPQMYWGKLLEPAVCAEFARRHPEFEITTAPTFHAPGREWHIANPDRLVLDAGEIVELVEAKTARDETGWGEEGTDEIPVHYRCQVIWYMDALGVRRCHVAVLIAGSEYREYLVEYDPAEARILRDAGARFVASLRNGERPDIDGHTATYQTIRQLPEGLDDVDVEIDPMLRERFHTAQDVYWAAEDELTECKSRLLDAIGTGRRAVVLRERVATRTVRNGRTYQLLPSRTRRTAA